MAQMRSMGGLSALMDKMPAQIAQAAGQLPAGAENKMVGRVEGIINSMTPAERAKPELIKASRKRRIATGAGVQVQDVNRLLNQFEQMQKMMKQFSKGGIGKLMRGMKGMVPGMR
jgi:signal recognition particle subunit SRP54